MIDISIVKTCVRCKTSEPLRHAPNLVTMGEHSTVELVVDQDEFSLCPICHSRLRLKIQAQPYEQKNHLNSPVAIAMHEYERSKEG